MYRHRCKSAVTGPQCVKNLQWLSNTYNTDLDGLLDNDNIILYLKDEKVVIIFINKLWKIKLVQLFLTVE